MPSASGRLGLSALPPLPEADVAQQRVEAMSGILFVSLLVLLLWGGTELVLTDDLLAAEDVGVFAFHVCISAQAAFSFCCLMLLVSDVCRRTVGRSEAACFPLPDDIQRFLETRKGSPLMENRRDEAGRRSFCIRCLVWREDKERVHHCTICQRCVPDWDHHCFAFGVCISGTLWPPRGNRLVFVCQILVAATALVTLLGSTAYLMWAHGHFASVSLLHTDEFTPPWKRAVVLAAILVPLVVGSVALTFICFHQLFFMAFRPRKKTTSEAKRAN